MTGSKAVRVETRTRPTTIASAVASALGGKRKPVLEKRVLIKDGKPMAYALVKVK